MNPLASGGGRNLWELTVLCLLREKPLHPYEMQRLMRQRRQDHFLDLKRGSLYHAIARLEKGGLITAVETSREGKRPERTVYAITEIGEREVLDWLRDMLAKPAYEPTQFLAAVAFAPQLPPVEVREQLEDRIDQTMVALRNLEGVRSQLAEFLPRVLRLRIDYICAMTKAELEWVKTVVAELASGAIDWDRNSVYCGVEPPDAGEEKK